MVDGKTELDPLRDSQSVKLAEKRRHMLTLSRRVDEASSSVQDRLSQCSDQRLEYRSGVVDRRMLLI